MPSSPITPQSGTEELYRRFSPDDTTTAASVVLKVRGETCNIDCLYCFEKRKEAPGGATIDADAVGAIAELFGAKPIVVELHGGEPLTASRDHMRTLLDRLAAAHNVHGVTLQTNGMLLDQEWLDLFDRHYPDLQITISLDGDPLGNSWRVDYDGQPTHQRVEAAIALLASRGRSVGITTVVNSNNVHRPIEVLDYLAGFGNVHAINLIACFEATVAQPTASPALRITPSRQLQQEALADGLPRWATTAEEYAQFVLTAAEHWIRTGLWRRIQLAPVVAIIRRLRGLDVRSCHFNDRKCEHVFTAYPDGRFGSCDELPWPRARLTMLPNPTAMRAVLQAQSQSPLLTAGRALMSKCATCDYRTTCGGGCLSHRLGDLAAHGDDTTYCAHRMRLVDGVAALVSNPSHPEGAACLTISWLPQSPNSMRDVTGFISRWNDPYTARTPARLLRSPAGNINTVGAAGLHEADDLDPLHPQWRAGIEDGVWPLVDAITSLGFITYDSCEGHPLGPPDLAAKGVRVGILPRTPHDAARVANLLCAAVSTARTRMPGSAAVRACRNELLCQTTGRRFPVLDLRIEPASPTALDSFYAARLSAVAEVRQALLDPNARVAVGTCSCADTPALAH